MLPLYLPRRRLVPLAIVLLAVVALAADVSRRPADQLSARGLLGAIHLYQATLSPRMGSQTLRRRRRRGLMGRA